MKSRGVVSKLFGLTSSVLILFFLLMSVGQLFFFEEFYKHREIRALEANTRTFAEQYRDREGREEAVDAASKFLNENKAQIAVVDENGNYLFDNPFKILMVLRDGREVTVPLYVYRDSGQLLKAELKPGDEIAVTGLFQYEGSQTVFYSTQIVNESGRVVLRTPEYAESKMQVLTGRIVRVDLPPPNQWNIREGVFNFAIFGNFPLAKSELEALRSGSAVTKEWVEPWSDAPNLVLLYPISKNGTLSGIAMAVSSIAELETTYESLKIYYAYFGIAGVVLILLLSVLYSRIVARPLLVLNKAAIRLEGMDFSVIEPLDRGDEFGLLSRNLSSLARKLDTALSQLRQANSRLLSDIESKKRLERIQQVFISDVSHELKTPLSIIGSYAEGLKENVAGDRQDEYVDIILDECKRMEALILNMLLLMRYDSDMSPFRPVAFPLREQLERLGRLLKARLIGRNLALELRCEEDSLVYADPVLVERILLNLLSNAIRHARTGSALTVRAAAGSRGSLRIEVENRGEPIPAPHLERLWDRFYRVEEGRSRETDGSGLGLAIVKRIVEDHGQSCGVFNTDDGVVFWFTLERFSEERRASS